MKYIDGGITAPLGFRCSGIHCGLRKNKTKKDIALIVTEKPCPAAGMFTTNKVYAAPVGVTKAHLENGMAQAVIVNSGNANACTVNGYEAAGAVCHALAEKLGISENDIIVASTGVIGVPLPIEPIIGGIDALIAGLDSTPEASLDAAVAIMTTDTKKKEYALTVDIDGKAVKLGAICKGSGMIHPNMATMLCFITTDAAISPEYIKKALAAAVPETFNMISVDRDTSTNDTAVIMASGCAGNRIIDSDGDDYRAFAAALYELCKTLAMSIAADGEGATKLVECNVSGFTDIIGAKRLAKSVITSPLVKAAMFGSDANWGRILCALGYSGTDFDTGLVDVSFSSKAGELMVCQNGKTYPFDEDVAKAVLSKEFIAINIDMKCGSARATAWGCDLSYEYVRINGDYRS